MVDRVPVYREIALDNGRGHTIQVGPLVPLPRNAAVSVYWPMVVLYRPDDRDAPVIPIDTYDGYAMLGERSEELAVACNELLHHHEEQRAIGTSPVPDGDMFWSIVGEFDSEVNGDQALTTPELVGAADPWDIPLIPRPTFRILEGDGAALEPQPLGAGAQRPRLRVVQGDGPLQ